MILAPPSFFFMGMEKETGSCENVNTKIAVAELSRIQWLMTIVERPDALGFLRTVRHSDNAHSLNLEVTDEN